MTEVDGQIGRITDALRQNGYWDNTIIIVTSDHGEMLGDHCQLGKSGFFDQSYHIPLIIRDPSAANGFGTTVTEFTESVDMFPTLMSLLNEAVPHQLNGYSLAAQVRVEKPDRQPNPINIDQSGTNNAAIKQYNFEEPFRIKICQFKFLNNIFEQDHRLIKRITKPMLGLRNFWFDLATMSGIELIRVLKKRQMSGQVRMSKTSVENSYGLAGVGRHVSGYLSVWNLSLRRYRAVSGYKSLTRFFLPV